MNSKKNEFAESGVAIVGISLKLPGADTVEQYWSNLVNRVDSVTTFSPDQLDLSVPTHIRELENYIPCRGVIENADKFDAAFFGLSPLEAQVMDPQHRIFLQLSWSALEDAGCLPESFDGLIGVYAGASTNMYFYHHVSPRPDIMRRIGDYPAIMLSEKDYLATRVSYCLNLRGPSVAINTACSTSLVAVSEAYQHLMTYQCDAAIAGGVCVYAPQKTGYLWQEGTNFSKTGRVRPFDHKADGMVGGNGAGAVVLKRLDDAIENRDRIYAVIRGAAVNNDGSQKIGFSAPSIRGQTEVVSFAQAEAEVTPESIGYIETHGTATRIGDQIETEALRSLFRDCDENSVVLGGVKSNLGHLDAAAGVAGLIKAALSLSHKQIPPTVHFETFNPDLQMENSPFWVNTETIPFEGKEGPRRAGVTALGLGGTNAHVILEEAPPSEVKERIQKRSRVFALSAKSNDSLVRAHEKLADYLANHPDENLDDVGYTLADRRTAFPIRSAVVSTDTDETIRRLRQTAASIKKLKKPKSTERTTVFVFPGQGVQYAGMGADLYRKEPVFKEIVDYCADHLKPILGMDIRDVIFCIGEGEDDANETLRQTVTTQPAIFVIEYALARLWEHYGVKPDAMIGHSIGQYAAACLSGVFGLDDCLLLVAERGRVIQEMAPGVMLSVPMSAEALEERIRGRASVASVNAPELCVASGEQEIIEQIEKELREAGIGTKILRTSHAFHSDMMTKATAEFEVIAGKVAMKTPSIPIVCTSTGTWITDEQATSPKHWADQIRRAVLFSPGIETLMADSKRVFIEVGPRNTMTTLTRRHFSDQDTHIAIPSMGKPEDSECDAFGMAIGLLMRNGGNIDIQGQFDSEEHRLVSLPSYSFLPKSHWIPAARSDFQGENPLLEAESNFEISKETDAKGDASSESSFTPVQLFLVRLWEDLLGASDIGLDDDFFDLGGHSLIGIQLLDRINTRYHIKLLLSDILRHSTLQAMASFIEENTAAETDNDTTTMEEKWTPLVPLSIKGKHSPLYCVAGIGGHCMELKQLGDELEDIPFYGLETRGVVEGHQPHETIEAQATEHIEAIRAVQPKGPYYLSGYSIGGVVAFEMAKQLVSQGEEIAWLGLIDTGSPILPRRSRLDFRRVQLKRFLKDPSAYVQNALARRQRDRTRQPGERYAHIYITMSKARNAYNPKPYNGDLALFRTRKSEYIDDFQWTISETNGWRPLVGGELDVVPVLGRHLTVVQESANAKYLAKKITENILTVDSK